MSVPRDAAAVEGIETEEIGFNPFGGWRGCAVCQKPERGIANCDSGPVAVFSSPYSLSARCSSLASFATTRPPPSVTARFGQHFARRLQFFPGYPLDAGCDRALLGIAGALSRSHDDRRTYGQLIALALRPSYLHRTARPCSRDCGVLSGCSARARREGATRESRGSGTVDA